MACQLKDTLSKMVGEMKLRYPGLIEERMPSGNIRYRVRVAGDKKRRIALTIAPDHREFHEAYLAARAGKKYAANQENPIAPGTVGWMVEQYLAHLAAQVASGTASELTLKQRRSLCARLITEQSTSGRSNGKPYGELPMEIPPHELLALRDRMMATPGAAKNMFKMLKAMYRWAVERQHCQQNPAAAINVEYRSQGGATPWTTDDLLAYRKVHKPGSMAHLCLTLFMFTACRIGDAYRLGRAMEIKRDGQTWLEWTPGKKGSRPVSIPMLPPLQRAISAQSVIGATYLLTERGEPFRSPEALRNRLKKWMEEAKIEGRSSHGIRKAAGHLLALNGATQYEIMAVHGHAQASTSQVYTETVDRMKLAAQAGGKMAGWDW